MNRLLPWTLATVAAFAALVAVVIALPLERGSDGSPDGSIPGAVGHPDPYPAPDFRLLDHREDERTLEDFRGQWLALFFGFTHCPDVCPITLGNLTQALDGLGEDADEVAVALVSVDPERDTPERLAEYLEAFHSSIVGLTGERDTIEEVAADYGIFADRMDDEAQAESHAPGDHPPDAEEEAPHEGHAGHGEDAPGAGEGYMVDHSSFILMVDPDGRIVTSFPPFTSGDELEEAFRYLLENY